MQTYEIVSNPMKCWSTTEITERITSTNYQLIIIQYPNITLSFS